MKKIAIAAIVLSLAGASGALAQNAPAAGGGAGTGGGLGGGLGLGAGVGASFVVPIAALTLGVAAIEGGRSDSTTATATSTN